MPAPHKDEAAGSGTQGGGYAFISKSLEESEWEEDTQAFIWKPF